MEGYENQFQLKVAERFPHPFITGKSLRQYIEYLWNRNDDSKKDRARCHSMLKTVGKTRFRMYISRAIAREGTTDVIFTKTQPSEHYKPYYYISSIWMPDDMVASNDESGHAHKFMGRESDRLPEDWDTWYNCIIVAPTKE